MVHFKDITEDRRTFMVTLDGELELLKSGTRFRTFPSILGAGEWPKFFNPVHANRWSRSYELPKDGNTWTLEPAHHVNRGNFDNLEPLPTLGRRIFEERLSWGNSVEFLGEAHYFKGYWEWTEDILSRCGDDLRKIGIYDAVYASLFTYEQDTEVIKAFCESWCPSTNTLLTSCGELSISLWDLHVLSGLPMDGMLYDEVVPTAKELLYADGGNSSRVQISCKHLFHAYHTLRSKRDALHLSISVEEWIKFWSRGPIVYQRPPPRKGTKRRVRPKQTHNPTGEIKDHALWTSSQRIPFTELGVNRQSWSETYLAAFIACWLSTFVLPEGDANSIRPSTFKMASLMASKKGVALVVPVLTSIYRGLNKISKLQSLSQVRASFPIHFVYGWLALYFNTHFPINQSKSLPRMVQYSGVGGVRNLDFGEAHKRIYRWEYIAWTCTAISKENDVFYVDGEDVNEHGRLFFMAIRSNYLAWRFDDEFIIEPYSPHRFSRQFGYYQTHPGNLKNDVRRASFDDGIRYWRACLLRKSFSKATFPKSIANANRSFSVSYKQWWDVVYGDFLAQLAKHDDHANDKQADSNGGVKKVHLTPLENKKKRKVPLKEKSKLDEPSNGKKEATLIPLECGKKHKGPLKEKDKLGEPSNGLGDKELNVLAKGKDKLDESFIGERRSPLSSLDGSASISTERHWNRRKCADSVELIEDDANHTHPSAKEVEEALGIDDLEDSHSCASAQSAGVCHDEGQMVVKPTSPLGAKSEFNGKAVLGARLKQFLTLSWGDLRDKIMRTSVDDLSSIECEISNGIDEMKQHCGAFDISHLEDSLKALFAEARGYDELRSASHDSKGSTAQRLKEVETMYFEMRANSRKEADQIDAIKKKIASLSASLQEIEAKHHMTESKVRDLKVEVVKLKNASLLDDDMLESLRNAKDDLENTRQCLKDENPFA